MARLGLDRPSLTIILSRMAQKRLDAAESASKPGLPPGFRASQKADISYIERAVENDG